MSFDESLAKILDKGVRVVAKRNRTLGDLLSPSLFSSIPTTKTWLTDKEFLSVGATGVVFVKLLLKLKHSRPVHALEPLISERSSIVSPSTWFTSFHVGIAILIMLVALFTNSKYRLQNISTILKNVRYIIRVLLNILWIVTKKIPVFFRLML